MVLAIPAPINPERKPWPTLSTGTILFPFDLHGLMILLVNPNAASPRVFPMLSKGDCVVVVVVGRNGRLGMLMPLPAIPDITLPMLSIPGNSN